MYSFIKKSSHLASKGYTAVASRSFATNNVLPVPFCISKLNSNLTTLSVNCENHTNTRSHILSRGSLGCINFQKIQNMSTSEDLVLFDEVNSKGIVTLNNPKALNSLTEEMVETMYPVLKKWENEKKLVIVRGNYILILYS